MLRYSRRFSLVFHYTSYKEIEFLFLQAHKSDIFIYICILESYLNKIDRLLAC